MNDVVYSSFQEELGRAVEAGAHASASSSLEKSAFRMPKIQWPKFLRRAAKKGPARASSAFGIPTFISKMTPKHKKLVGGALGVTAAGGLGAAGFTALRRGKVREVTGRVGYPKKKGFKTFAVGSFALLVKNDIATQFQAVAREGNARSLKRFVLQQERAGKLKAFKK